MMTTIDLLLMHYAAGSLNASESLIVAAHVAINPEARRKVTGFEALGGRMIEKEMPAAVSNDCLAAVMRRILDCKPCAEEEFDNPATPDADPLAVPENIRRLICGHCTESEIRWKKLAEGVESVDLRVQTPKPCGRKLRLMRLQGGRTTPRHSHRGREIMLVLGGGYSDEFGHFRKGDIEIVIDPGIAHAPTADPEGCLCLVLTDRPLRFTEPFRRFMNLFRRV